VDPDPGPSPDTARDRLAQPLASDPGTDRPRVDVADAAPAVAHTMLLLGAIENRSDAAMAGAAEVTGAAATDAPIPVVSDPLDDYADYPAGDGSPTDVGAGCLGGAFALLLVLTAAAGTAVALVR
jgi:hypothetical protein